MNAAVLDSKFTDFKVADLGLAVQDLAVARAVYERWRTDPGAEAFGDVVQLDAG